MRLITGFVTATILLFGAILFCHAQPIVYNEFTTNAVPPASGQLAQLESGITKLIEAIGSLGAAILILARVLRKLVPDGWQTGIFGRLLAHTALEVNPQLTPTPPNVAKPSVELKDVSTGATVEPVEVPQTKPPAV